MALRRRIVTAIVLAAGVASALSVRLSRPELHTDEILYMSRVLESMIHGSVLPLEAAGAPFVNKPPLALWLMRLSFEVLDPGPLAARLPSVLAATATAAVLYLFAAAFFGEGVGVLAALVFAATPGLLTLHGIRSATADALEILLVTSAIVCLEVWRRRRRRWALAGLVTAAAASAWVKSPFALVVILVYLLATELPARRAGRGTPRLGATLALVAGVWAGAYLLWLGTAAAYTSPRAVAKRLLLRQYVRRIEGRLSAGHAHGPGFYPASVAGDFGPLLLLPAGAAAAGWLAARRGRPVAGHDVACLVAWSLAAPLLATASANKMPWYAYLSYPGLALLVAGSADLLARQASQRRAVQSALLAVVVLALAWRLPAGRLWPEEAQYRGLTGRLWEIAHRDAGIEVVPGSGFRMPRQRHVADREARFFVRALLLRQSRSPRAPGTCRATLLNDGRDAPDGEALELHRPGRRGIALFMHDGCNGWLLRQLAGGPIRAAPEARTRNVRAGAERAGRSRELHGQQGRAALL